MAWLSAPLTMPLDAGENRSGGTRLQMPNVMRPRQSGGEGWAFIADATLTYLGTSYTIPGGVQALCDEGGTAMATSAHYYIVYALASAPTVPRACWQEHWAATYSATDCIGIAYVTEHYSLYLHVLVTRGCTNLNPTPTLLTPKTNGTNFPMADGTPLANADLRNLRGLAYDSTTGTLILSIGVGFIAQTTGVSASNDRVFSCGADGLLHDTGLCAATAAYDTAALAALAAVWTPQGWSISSGALFHQAMCAPHGTAMCCRGGKLYTIQYAIYAVLSKSGHFENYDLSLGLIRSFDLTTHTQDIHAVAVYSQRSGFLVEEYVSQSFNHLALAIDSSGNFYTTFCPAAYDHTSIATWRIYSGIVQIPNPGAGVAIVNMAGSDPGLPSLTPPVAAWAGGIGVDQTIPANYAEGLSRTAAAVGAGDSVVGSSAAMGMTLDVDGHDTVLFAAAQVDQGNSTIRWPYIRAIDAAAGTLSTIIGNFSDRDATTAFATYAGLPAYPGDASVAHDGTAANSLAATWGGVVASTATGATAFPPVLTNSVRIVALDRMANILYFIDQGFSSIRSIKLDDGNLLCTLTGGPSYYTAADHTNGIALGPAQQMRGYPVHLAIDESTGNLYYTLASTVSGATVYDLYRAKFY